jgi:hypothetical protein
MSRWDLGYEVEHDGRRVVEEAERFFALLRMTEALLRMARAVE